MDVHEYIGAPDGCLPSYFEPMLRDRGRSDQYSTAIRLELARFRREQGRPAVVLDIGCGTGLLTALALKWGAKAVVACDLNALMSKGLAPTTLELEEEELDEPAEGAWGGYIELSGEEALAATATAGIAGGAAGVVLRHPRTGQVVKFVHGQYDPAKGSPPVDMWVTEILGTLTTSELMPSILNGAAAGLRQFRVPSGELTRYCVPREARQYATSYTVSSFVGPPIPPNDDWWMSSNDADDQVRLYQAAHRVGSRRLIRHDELARPSGPVVHSTICKGVAQMGPGSNLLVLEWECELHPGVVLRNLLDTLEEDLPSMEAREGRYAAWGFWMYRVEAPVKFQVAGYDARDAVPNVWVRDEPRRKMLLPPRQKRRPVAEPQDLEHTRLGVVTPASCSEFSEIGGAVFAGLDAIVPVDKFVELSGSSLYSSEPEGPEDEEVWHQVADPATNRLWLGRAAPDWRVVLTDPPRFVRLAPGQR